MALNAFRLLGDLVKILSTLILLNTLRVEKNAQGISRKTVELILMVHCLRYLDLFIYYYSFYNSALKLFHICTTALALLIMYHDPVRNSVNSEEWIRHWRYLFLPSLAAGFAVHIWHDLFNDMYYPLSFRHYNTIGACWAISIILEAAALIPQMLIYSQTQRPRESLNGGTLLFLLGAYRGLYVLNWVCRANTEHGYKHHYLVYMAGSSQAFVGLVSTRCGFGTKGPAGNLWPHMVKAFRKTKAAWLTALIYLICFGGIIADDLQRPIRSNVIQVEAMMFMSVVLGLVVVLYCGFSTHKEVPNDLSLTESLLSTDDSGLLSEEDGTVSRPAKVIKKGIFIHGIQVV